MSNPAKWYYEELSRYHFDNLRGSYGITDTGLNYDTFKHAFSSAVLTRQFGFNRAMSLGDIRESAHFEGTPAGKVFDSTPSLRVESIRDMTVNRAGGQIGDWFQLITSGAACGMSI